MSLVTSLIINLAVHTIVRFFVVDLLHQYAVWSVACWLLSLV